MNLYVSLRDKLLFGAILTFYLKSYLKLFTNSFSGYMDKVKRINVWLILGTTLQLKAHPLYYPSCPSTITPNPFRWPLYSPLEFPDLSASIRLPNPVSRSTRKTIQLLLYPPPLNLRCLDRSASLRPRLPDLPPGHDEHHAHRLCCGRLALPRPPRQSLWDLQRGDHPNRADCFNALCRPSFHPGNLQQPRLRSHRSDCAQHCRQHDLFRFWEPQARLGQTPDDKVHQR